MLRKGSIKRLYPRAWNIWQIPDPEQPAAWPDMSLSLIAHSPLATRHAFRLLRLQLPLCVRLHTSDITRGFPSSVNNTSMSLGIAGRAELASVLLGNDQKSGLQTHGKMGTKVKGKHRPAVDILLGPFPTKISKREYMGSSL